jgi:16S rRNA (cytosine1402-N4)-methyltransferase
MQNDHGHIPVLLNEVLEHLSPKPGDIVLDLTLGRGGHAIGLAERIGPSGHLIGLDADAENASHAKVRLESANHPCTIIHDNFVRIAEIMADLGLQANVVLADLGVASNQLDDIERGFSFAADAPLDMRLNTSAHVTGADLVNALPEQDLAQLIYQVGEEPLGRKIAAKIAQERAHTPILTTGQLRELVVRVYGMRARSSRRHPATRTFMAIRVAVNDELAALDTLLARIESASSGTSWLTPGARVGMIAFHSLEDRPVKQCFARLAAREVVRLPSRSAIRPCEEELARNSRSRSARLRIMELAGS